MTYVFREYRSKGKPWCIAYTGVDGKQRRERTDAPTKELAKKLLAKKLVQVTEAKIAGVTLEPSKVTFKEFMKDYLAHVNARKTAGSVERDERSVATLTAAFGHRKLRDITTGMIQKYVDDRRLSKSVRGRPFAPATVNRELMCLSAIFREAVKRGHVEKNPARGVKQLPEDNIIVRYLSDEEEAALLGACNATLKPMVLTSLHAGLRRGEVLSLTWENVDFEQRLLKLVRTKSKKTRYVPINAVLLETLKAAPKYRDCPYVFANPKTKTRWRDKNISWKYALKKSGVKNFRFHDLRHTFASRLVQAGVPLKVVQELLGHSNILVTMRYAHLGPTDMRDAVDVLATWGKPKAPAPPAAKPDDGQTTSGAEVDGSSKE